MAAAWYFSEIRMGIRELQEADVFDPSLRGLSLDPEDEAASLAGYVRAEARSRSGSASDRG